MSIRAGFIGLGNIGEPMAERLVRAGLPTTVFDLRESAMQALAGAGAQTASSCRKLAAGSDVIGICVRDDADVRTVVFGEEGALAGASAGSVIAIHSTVLPSTVLEIGAAAAERGIGTLDACITGGAAGAKQGTLSYMVGGEKEHLERCRPAFQSSAKQIIHTGPLGSGAATKLCNNLMTYQGFLAAFEATLLARTAGLSQDALEEVGRSNGNLNEQQLAFLGLHKLPAEQRTGDPFQQLLRGFLELADKDLSVTLAFAREHGVALPGTALCQQLMARVYGVEDELRR
ncbi:MAG: NAD(P)-dependent oxidoreductase [Myxococcales bacterium]|nr:NAD(P)-dependent oxidoreductase [Myxococcales bacterium]